MNGFGIFKLWHLTYFNFSHQPIFWRKDSLFVDISPFYSVLLPHKLILWSYWYRRSTSLFDDFFFFCKELFKIWFTHFPSFDFNIWSPFSFFFLYIRGLYPPSLHLTFQISNFHLILLLLVWIGLWNFM